MKYTCMNPVILLLEVVEFCIIGYSGRSYRLRVVLLEDCSTGRQRVENGNTNGYKSMPTLLEINA